MNTDRIEAKLGFDRIRKIISDRCSTEYAASRTAGEKFCTDENEIRRRLPNKSKSNNYSRLFHVNVADRWRGRLRSYLGRP